jgi:hypothetical protein
MRFTGLPEAWEAAHPTGIGNEATILFEFDAARVEGGYTFRRP